MIFSESTHNAARLCYSWCAPTTTLATTGSLLWFCFRQMEVWLWHWEMGTWEDSMDHEGVIRIQGDYDFVMRKRDLSSMVCTALEVSRIFTRRRPTPQVDTCSWTSQAPELWAKQIFILYKLLTLWNSVTLENRLFKISNCKKYWKVLRESDNKF